VGSEEDEATERKALELEVLKAADLFQAEGLLKHCLERFREALTVHTVVEQLVWAHKSGPEEARALAREYFVAHARAVRNKAPATMELLKALSVDVYHELLLATLD
jgi:hypothetical protein